MEGSSFFIEGTDTNYSKTVELKFINKQILEINLNYFPKTQIFSPKYAFYSIAPRNSYK